MSFTFEKFERIRTKKDFDTVFQKGFFFKKSFCFTVVYMLNNLDYSRIGIIVKKKHGCSVKRNYERRVLKELFRTNKPKLKNNYDLIFIIKNLSSYNQKKYDFEFVINKIQDTSNY
ncbi:MAG: ribonuclease P protein component [Spirochaetes bacterium GWF1_31_7]|nr:MAG: ribonuclease P protein component [Spirochaetes bacterium GWE1_32_154]OHD50013.1 MAG: ribonuclease P protein component [Spirochaetes bacterium GWE2_31_10]OHD52328.1 MAG: ribonuclease P protein component [Spirochaetes bacterium GWF1_31_7]HBI38477.1 ribonuclease P protein component [Spirochaetia bacterium]